MQWKAPESDGGAPITHYVIEMKEKNMNSWVEGKKLTVKEVQEMGGMIKGKQDGLIEGCEYQFRIKAINKGGPSIPGPPSLPMIAKTRFRECMFFRLDSLQVTHCCLCCSTSFHQGSRHVRHYAEEGPPHQVRPVVLG